MNRNNDFILSYLLDEDDYDRLQSRNAGNGDDIWQCRYAFVAWNIKCINALSAEDHAWLMELCTRLGGGTIMLVDLESCAEFRAFAFYYNQKKRLCIVNPR